MPKAVIDWEQFKELCAIQCTAEEIASVLDVSRETLYQHIREEFGCTFKEAFDRFAPKGHASLRRRQWRKALEDGDVQMLKHLGKHHLGQVDRVDLGFDPNAPVKFVLSMGKDLERKTSHEKNTEETE